MAGDYIRRDLAKKRFSKRLMWLKEDVHDEYSGALLDGCEADIELLDEIPAADVAPVVRGKWCDNGIAGSMLVKCSVCGFDCGANSFSYCPNCGARMRQAKRGKTQRKYREILALYLYCVEVRMDARLERLHDGWAIRFPNGGDFAQHAGTYGTNDGFV